MNAKTASHVEALRGKHAELDGLIKAEQKRPLPDSLVLRGLKGEKCAIRTEIALLSGELRATDEVSAFNPAPTDADKVLGLDRPTSFDPLVSEDDALVVVDIERDAEAEEAVMGSRPWVRNHLPISEERAAISA